MRNTRRTILAALAAAALGVVLPTGSSEAVTTTLMPYIQNNCNSDYNLTVTTTTPTKTLKGLKPCYGASAYGFYASCSYTTVYWLPGKVAARTATPCAWTMVGSSTTTWQVMVMPKVY